MPHYTVADLPASDRPRERLRRRGAAALSDAELLAIVLRAGTQERNVLELARHILAAFDLDRLADASRNELQEFDGVGPVKAGRIRAVLELCQRFSSQSRSSTGQTIESFQDAIPHLREMERFDEERVGLLCLDSTNTVRAKELDLLRGSVDRVSVEPRIIVSEAVRQKASGVILAHNHPGGDPEPSDQDVAATADVRAALETVDIELLDHVVVGDGVCRSLRKDGLL